VFLNFVKDKISLANITDYAGNTALIYAAESKQLDVIKILLKGVENKKLLLSQTSKDGATAFTIAKKNNHHTLLHLLNPNG
jgi:ankyrin repeat protein